MSRKGLWIPWAEDLELDAGAETILSVQAHCLMNGKEWKHSKSFRQPSAPSQACDVLLSNLHVRLQAIIIIIVIINMCMLLRVSKSVGKLLTLRHTRKCRRHCLCPSCPSKMCNGCHACRHVAGLLVDASEP
jgi:hypothetical protein